MFGLSPSKEMKPEEIFGLTCEINFFLLYYIQYIYIYTHIYIISHTKMNKINYEKVLGIRPAHELLLLL